MGHSETAWSTRCTGVFWKTVSYRRSLPRCLQIPGHQSVFINEPRLSDFKQVLLREGIQAEFVGGVLVCNNMVAVRRVSVLPPGTVSLLSISSPQHQSPPALDTGTEKWPAQKALACFCAKTMQSKCSATGLIPVSIHIYSVIHSFSKPCIVVRVAGCWSLSQCSLGRRRGNT